MSSLSNNSQISKFHAFINSFFNPLVPHLCIACESPAQVSSYPALCDFCSTTQWQKPKCKRCNRTCHPSEKNNKRCSHCKEIRYSFVDFQSLGPYKLWLKEAILMYKFNQDPLALLYLQSQCDRFDLKDIDSDSIITFISSHKKRLTERRVKEQHLIKLLDPIKKKHDIPIVETLKKTSNQTAQINLSGSERRKAVLGTLEWNYEGKLPKKVFLFDDVWTTGSTMKEAARVIKEAGVEKVYCRTFAAIDYR